MGKPAIVTSWSGPADFVEEDTGWLINYTLKEVGGGRDGIMAEGLGQVESVSCNLAFSFLPILLEQNFTMP